MFDIKRIINRILIRFPLLNSIISNIKFEEDKKCDTAYTDGKKVCYNPKYLESLNTSQQEFTICHELLHIFLSHIKRAEKRNMRLWNYATDAVINQLLVKAGMVMPEGVIDCSDAAAYSAEEYYEIAKQRPNIEETLASYERGNNSTHSNWSESEALDNQEQDITDEKEFTERNEKEIKKEAERYAQSVEQEAKNIGSFTSQEIKTSKEVINWRLLLNRLKRKVISGDYDFFNGEFDEEGIYRYPYVVKRTCPVEILIDTSGSVDDNLVKTFLSQVKNILGQVPIDIGCFDTKFYGFHRIEKEKDIDKFEIEGRGGTDFDIAVSSFTPKSKLRIIFTDGLASMPQTEADVYWFVYSGVEINPPGGHVIRVNEEELTDGKMGMKRSR